MDLVPTADLLPHFGLGEATGRCKMLQSHFFSVAISRRANGSHVIDSIPEGGLGIGSGKASLGKQLG